MEPGEPILARRIKTQATVNYLVSCLSVASIVIFSILVQADVILTLSLIVIGVECLLTGIVAQKAATTPSLFTASRYSRIQFINWIVWILLGGVSVYLMILVLAYEGYSTTVIAIVGFLGFSVYLGICFMFYSFLKNARRFAYEFMDQYRGLQEGHQQGSAGMPIPGQAYNPPGGFNGQVVYPGQAYLGAPSGGVYVAQPVYNASNPSPPLSGQAYDLQNNSGK